MEIKVYKAIPAIKAEPVESVTITISEETPIYPTLEAQDFHFDMDAQKLEEALYNSLPGGIYDRLLGKMLVRKASHFRVRHEETAAQNIPQATFTPPAQQAAPALRAPVGETAPAALADTGAVDLIIDTIHSKMDLNYRKPLITETQIGMLAPAIESAFSTGDKVSKRHAALRAITGKSSLKEIDINQASLLWHWLKPYKDSTLNWQINAESAKDLLKLVAELDKQNQLPLA